MERKTKPYDLHVLVCTNTRANSEKKSCGPLGAETVREELKEWLRAEVAKRTPASDFVNTSVKPLKGRAKCRVNGSGCLDFCSNGIVIATRRGADQRPRLPHRVAVRFFRAASVSYAASGGGSPCGQSFSFPL